MGRDDRPQRVKRIQREEPSIYRSEDRYPGLGLSKKKVRDSKSRQLASDGEITRNLMRVYGLWTSRAHRLITGPATEETRLEAVRELARMQGHLKGGRVQVGRGLSVRPNYKASRVRVNRRTGESTVEYMPVLELFIHAPMCLANEYGRTALWTERMDRLIYDDARIYSDEMSYADFLDIPIGAIRSMTLDTEADTVTFKVGHEGHHDLFAVTYSYRPEEVTEDALTKAVSDWLEANIADGVSPDDSGEVK
jgi:hypothetical protein